jgi:hypothetical protein
VELAKMCRKVNQDELRRVESGYQCAKFFSWNKIGGSTLYLSNGNISLSNLPLHGYYATINCQTSSTEKTVSPLTPILVEIKVDIPNVSKGDRNLVAMPAFVLDYLIAYEIKQWNLNALNTVMSLFAVTKAYGAISLASNASTLQKIALGYNALKSTINAALTTSREAQQWLNSHDQIKKYWDFLQTLDAIKGVINTTNQLINNDAFYQFSAFCASWDVISKAPEIGKYIDVEEMSKTINELKKLYSDEGIVY